MDGILADGTTLVSAIRLVNEEERPNAVNLCALSMLVEALILHETITVLDTSRTAPSLRNYIGRYPQCIVIRDENIPSMLESYAARESKGFAAMTRSLNRALSEYSYPERAKHSDAAFAGARVLDKALINYYRGDHEMAEYLDTVEDFFGNQSPRPSVRELAPDPKKRKVLRRIFFPDSPATKGPSIYAWLSTLGATDDMASAGDFLVDKYSHVSQESPWRLGVNTNHFERGEFKRSLIIRAHFYLLASDFLGIPYRPDVLRAPICWKYFNQGSFSQFGIDESFVDAAERAAYDDVILNNRFLGRDALAFVPLFFGRVLAEAQSVEEILPRTLEIRESSSARRFREYMAGLNNLEAAGEANALIKEIRKYGALLREKYGTSSDTAQASGLSLLVSGADLAFSPSPGGAIGLSADIAKRVQPWWYKRKLALISRSMNRAGQAQLLNEQIKRVFRVQITDQELKFLQQFFLEPISLRSNYSSN